MRKSIEMSQMAEYLILVAMEHGWRDKKAEKGVKRNHPFQYI